MPTTTNFGWTTPADTDYVKDGALAIRTLGNGIDASMVDLKGGTSGQILAKNSNTDMDFVWIANDQGDITNVAVTAPITGGGSSGSVTIGIDDATTAQKGAVQLEDSTASTSTTKAATPNSVKSAYDLANAAIPKSLIDAAGDLILGTADNTAGRLAIGTNGYVLKSDGTTAAWAIDPTNDIVTTAGDILYATAADTLTRLGIGTAGQVLKVNSGATAPEWGASGSGALTLISSTSFSSSSAHNVNDVFSSTYQNYLVLINIDSASQTGYQQLRFRVSGSDNTTSNYHSSGIYNAASSTSPTGEGSSAATSFSYGYLESGGSDAFWRMEIANPNLAQKKIYTAHHNRWTGSTNLNYLSAGTFNGTTAFTGFTIYPAAGNITGKVRVYGLSN